MRDLISYFINIFETTRIGGEIAANTIKNVDERHYNAEDSITLNYTCTVALKFGLSTNENTLGESTAMLEADDKKTVLASELGNTAAENYLNVQNESPEINGEYKITVEL
ncbi:MAG: hypothetical protein WC644_08660 [Ignavibacteria bacterium]